MFTFKTEKPTGRYRSFFQNYHYIKLKKVEVGTIDDKERHKIRLQVIKADINEDGNPNCPWKMITFVMEFATVDEAKKFLNDHFDVITKKYNLWKGETTP
jgi:hypothetical protein